jgi:hypothetical protein
MGILPVLVVAGGAAAQPASSTATAQDQRANLGRIKGAPVLARAFVRKVIRLHAQGQ